MSLLLLFQSAGGPPPPVDPVLLSVQVISRDGTSPTYVSANSTGNNFFNDGLVRLLFKNNGASAITIRIDAPNTCSFDVADHPTHDIVATIGAGESELFGPFRQEQFNDPNNKVLITYTSVTGLDVAAIK